ncbi:hypothetical protein HYZ06_01160 [Candidatus Daviesbacteria bacterium]|nr:hypothetical protein [Candidatus Daviesbacteria bacterium]
MIKFLISLFILLFLTFPKSASAVAIASQTNQYSNILSVWQLIQELGDNLSGTAATFTFRISTQRYGIIQFDHTAQNSRIYDN